MDTKTRILTAAIEAFEAGGEAGLSLRDVAARVSLTPMALYRHYGDKQALVDAIVAHATQEWRARVAGIAPCAPGVWLLKIGDAFLEFSLEQPRLFEAAFLTNSRAALRYPDDFASGGSPAISLQLKLLDEIAIGAREPKTTAMEKVIILVSLSQGLVSLYRSGRISGDEKAFRRLYRRALRNCTRSFGLE